MNFLPPLIAIIALLVSLSLLAKNLGWFSSKSSPTEESSESKHFREELKKTTIPLEKQEQLLQIAQTKEGQAELAYSAHSRFDATYRYASFARVFAMSFLLVPVLAFVVSQTNGYPLASLIPACLFVAPIALYLFYLSAAPAQRIYFDKEHVYFGSTEENAISEENYPYIYTLTQTTRSLGTFFGYITLPVMVVARKRLTLPLFFYAIYDRFFPGSSPSRQVFIIGNAVRERGTLDNELHRYSDTARRGSFYPQVALHSALLERCKKNHVQIKNIASEWVYSAIAIGPILLLILFLIRWPHALGHVSSWIRYSSSPLETLGENWQTLREKIIPDDETLGTLTLVHQCSGHQEAGGCLGKHRLLLVPDRDHAGTFSSIFKDTFTDQRVLIAQSEANSLAEAPRLDGLDAFRNGFFISYGVPICDQDVAMCGSASSSSFSTPRSIFIPWSTRTPQSYHHFPTVPMSRLVWNPSTKNLAFVYASTCPKWTECALPGYIYDQKTDERIPISPSTTRLTWTPVGEPTQSERNVNRFGNPSSLWQFKNWTDASTFELVQNQVKGLVPGSESVRSIESQRMQIQVR